MSCAGFYLLLLLLPGVTWCQPRGYSSQGGVGGSSRLDEDEDGGVMEDDAPADRDLMTVHILNRSGILASLLSSSSSSSPNVQPFLREARASRPLLPQQLTKKATPGSRFALSLDVPTSILSVLIDLAKNQDMRAKAASNAELLARIGKRK
ncbi:urocortin-2-like [Engraulis encrasicolus]|uniref:urocortin-2-like n=1 Tax=Engraulis encrasicolus TaxID=184585 RepID=UPI002FD0CDB2